MSSKKENLESLLENLLNEADPIQRPTSMADFAAIPPEQVSLDQAIDRYLIQYERESIPTSEMYEVADVSDLTNYLFEQADEDEENETPEDEEGGDEPAGAELDLGDAGDVDPTGGQGGLDLGGLGGGEDEGQAAGGQAPAQQPVMQTPTINLQDFARNVARLTNNVQSLIDFKSIILNRSKRYIQNNYDERTAMELMEILETTYDLKPEDMSNHQIQDTEFPQPRTGVTGPVGG